MAWQDIIENMRNSEIAARALKYLFKSPNTRQRHGM